jgi:predicted  nucleic acid-binding Zn-ribbon protein
MKTENELLKLKSDIDRAKITVSELNGQLTALKSQLKEWDCKTVEEAEKKLKEMEQSISNFDVKIAEGVKELEEKYQ